MYNNLAYTAYRMFVCTYLDTRSPGLNLNLPRVGSLILLIHLMKWNIYAALWGC